MTDIFEMTFEEAMEFDPTFKAGYDEWLAEIEDAFTPEEEPAER